MKIIVAITVVCCQPGKNYNEIFIIELKGTAKAERDPFHNFKRWNAFETL